MANSKYETLDIETRLPEIEQMARDGYRDEDICKKIGISRATFYSWVTKYEEFAEAVRKGKEVVDAEIENKLLDNARGYTHWEVTEELMDVYDPVTGLKDKKLVTTKRVLKHIRPDTTSIIFWLKNRKPDQWRDKQHIAHEGQIGVTDLGYLTDEELEKELKGLKGDA